MTVLEMLYTLTIGPLQIMFEFIFWLSNMVFNNPGYSIIAMSIIVNLLLLPMSLMIDMIQANSFRAEKRLQPVVDHIKKTFTGDEQYMMLLTYYRQQNYRPTDALKGSLSLLLEIPFFIAAYNFLSNLDCLDVLPFGIISNLSKPDALLAINGYTINLLPILMTIINLFSCAVYSSEISSKNRIQLYIIAALFFFLLYSSPSGLLLYWTVNNLFSLIKNLIYKVKNKEPLKILLRVILFLLGITTFITIIFIHPMINYKRQIVVLLLSYLSLIPLLKYLYPKYFYIPTYLQLEKSNDRLNFFLGASVLTLLTGLLIPLSVINSSPEEFINTMNPINPFTYVIGAALLSTGTFILWGNIFYSLTKKSLKQFLSLCMLLLSCFALINYMGFGMNEGILSSELFIENEILPSENVKLINLAFNLITAVILFVLYKNKQKQLKFTFIVICFALFSMSLFNFASSHETLSSNSILNGNFRNTENFSIPLSKNGKNVVLIMLDRAINSYVPFIFKEKPELKKKFSGFTRYPNTLSYGVRTINAAPALFGGYDYTPININRRKDELLVNKHNEALRVMPVLFDEAGYKVTVSDPSYAGYKNIPDLSIFNDHPKIRTFITIGNYHKNPKEFGKQLNVLRVRNFFCYSLVQIVPLELRSFFYGKGDYFNPQKQRSNHQYYYNNLMQAQGIDVEFMKNYEILSNLSSLTDIHENGENTFLMMSNELTHSPAMLQLPEYTPESSVDNRYFTSLRSKNFYTIGSDTLKLNILQQIRHYHSNMATFIVLGKWFDYLRKEGVYDNTRIILVSDHGYDLKQLDKFICENLNSLDITWFNPLLMVKDFGSKKLTDDYTFMTNADCPNISMEGLIKNPINPATGNEINADYKDEAEQYVFYFPNSKKVKVSGNTFKSGSWFAVKNNVLSKSNWRAVDEPNY